MSEKWAAQLEQIKATNLYRSRRICNTPQGSEIQIDGRNVVSFCSNDYLGLANAPEVNSAFRSAVQRWGTGSGAAHLINGHTAAHHALEEELAAFVGRERALLFSSGYMANLGVISALLGRGDHVFEDRYNHASLLDAGLLSHAKLQRYQHVDAVDLADKLAAIDSGDSLVVTDGVFSMDGDIAPLQALSDVCQQNSAQLMVDDAHGLGVLSEDGKGTLAIQKVSVEQVPILMGTLGKAFGTFGAFVAGDADLIELLIQKARTYIYTTALPASLAEATRLSLQMVQNDTWRREYLQQLIAQFKEYAAQLNLPLQPSDTPIQPLVVGSSEKATALSDALLEQGILVTAIRPPTVPAETARLRITFSVNHSEKHMHQLCGALEQAFQNNS